MKGVAEIQELLEKARKVLAYSQQRRDAAYSEYERLVKLCHIDTTTVDNLMTELNFAEALEQARLEREARLKREEQDRLAREAAEAAARRATPNGGVVLAAHISSDCATKSAMQVYNPACIRCTRIKVVIALQRKTVAFGCSAQEEAIATAKAAKLKSLWGLKRGEVFDAAYYVAPPTPPPPPPPPPTPPDPIKVHHPHPSYSSRVKTNPTFGQRQSIKRGRQGGKVI